MAAEKKKNVDAAGRRARKAGEPPFENYTEHEPTTMQEFYANWLEEKTGYKVDLRSTILASVLRTQFQKSPENQARLAENAKRREIEIAELKERRAERAAAKAEEKAAKKAAPAEKPAKAEKATPAKKAAPKTADKPVKKTAAATAKKAATTKKASTKPAPRRRPAKSDDDF